MRAHSAWILGANFLPCLELLARVGETVLDEGMRGAFEGGLSGTNYDEGLWYDLPLGVLTVGIAKEESGKVFLRVTAPHGFARAVDAVTFACASYRLEIN
ncbi:hypothetical protein DAERI_030031 [Deinococcus aerius]|uniref:Uncharacterized protein n=1 Tax=Deinococcus aerius TaxID=200253 RepID=A0A2I9DWB9_9DEIO|nr:hypothetical protein [Deinococcus aerius]GBF04865.1 hypothetical protein DAERI_030031 [Deinococcus aerius]